MAKVKKAVDAAVDASRSVKSALNDILDMSTEARKARAAEQGFDTDRVLYHGTKSTDIDQFIPGGLSDSDTSGHGTGAMGTWFSDSVDVPNEFAGVTAFGRNGKEMAPNVIPAYSRHNNPKIYDANPEYIEVKRKIAELERPRDDEFYIGLNKATEGLTKRFHDMTGEFEGLSYQDASEIFSSKWNDIERQYTGGASEKLKQLRQRKAQLENSGEALDPFRQFMRDIGYRPGYGWDEGRSADIAADELWDSGYDAVEIKNTEFDAPDGKFVNQYMVLNPSKIRSVNATFDPAKRESANLLAGLAGAAVVGASVAPEDAEASFGGVLAKNADALMLSLAEEMKRLGKPRDEIWRKTGWMQGPDNKWRFEIDDSGAQSTRLGKSSYKEGKVGDYYLNDNLFSQYPGVEDVNLQMYKDGSGASYSSGMLARSKVDDTAIPIGARIETRGAGESAGINASNISHEAQHYVQDIEGFAKGGGPSDFSFSEATNATNQGNEIYDIVRSEFAEKLSAAKGNVNEILRLKKENPEQYDRISAIYQQFGTTDNDVIASKAMKLGEGLSPSEKYKRLAGEAEARNVQTRLNMTPDERRATPPWETLDVPESEQIVRMKGMADPMSLAITAAITGAATEFYRRRDSKKSFWQQRREELSDLINAGDEFIRPAMPYINSALEALDKPMQGYYGVASALGALAEGNGLDASLQRGATVARQPIEETAQEYGGVLADEGYPLAGTALNTAMQVTGPF